MDDLVTNLLREKRAASSALKDAVTALRHNAQTMKGIADAPQTASSVSAMRDVYQARAASGIVGSATAVAHCLLNCQYLDVLLPMGKTPAILGMGSSTRLDELNTLTRLDNSILARAIISWMIRCRDAIPGVVNNRALSSSSVTSIQGGGGVRIVFLTDEAMPPMPVLNRYVNYLNSKLRTSRITLSSVGINVLDVNLLRNVEALNVSGPAAAFFGEDELLGTLGIRSVEGRVSGPVPAEAIHDACVLSNLLISIGRYQDAHLY